MATTEISKRSSGTAGRANADSTHELFAGLEKLLTATLKNQEPERLMFEQLMGRLRAAGVQVPRTLNTPYINTIPVEQQPEYPGDREIERRIKSIIRWNAMAMVVNANRKSNGLGGHISSYASIATLYEVGFNHFFRGGDDGQPADQVFFQGHTTPGNYARA
jgi:pyruvate dehydrogenase E1 component